MVKIIFSNGESVEWNEGNLPDSLLIHFSPPEKEAVPDHISADHIEGLCNMLYWAAQTLYEKEPNLFNGGKLNRYMSSISYARERAKWLRKGQTA